MNLQNKLDLTSSIGLYIKLAEKSLERTIDYEIKQKFGLASSHWKIILILGIKDGFTQRELAELSFVESPTLVPILDKMEKLELLTRKNDPYDRRTNRVFLTLKAKKLAEQLSESILDFRKQIIKKIPKKNLEVSQQVLKQLIQNSDDLLRRKGEFVPSTILDKI